DPDDDDKPWTMDAYDAWMPVDLYVGGAEHTVLHLLYARFWHKVLFDLGHVRHPEPFMKLVHQGTILGEDNERMVTSPGIVVIPDDIVREYGADALRLYEMFMGPLEAVKPWQTSQIQGVVRFRDRLHAVCRQPLVEAMDDATRRLLHRTIKKVSTDIDAMAFNTAISALNSAILAPLVFLDPPPPPFREAARGGAGARPARLAVRPARRRGAVAASRPRGNARIRALARVGRGPRGRRRDRAPRSGERQ